VAPSERTVEEIDNAITTSGSAFADANQDLPDYDEFLMAVSKDDPHVLQLLQTVAGNRPPKSREEYVKFAAKVQMEKDMALVSTLSKEVFTKSDAIDFWLTQIPGIHRNRHEQMDRIDELIKLNKDQEDEWLRVYQEAKDLQHRMRDELQNVTSSILGPVRQNHNVLDKR
jgi:hypothetical protein